MIAAPFGSHDGVDKTLTCTTLTQAGYHIIELGAGPTRPPSSSFRQTAQLILATGGDTFYGTRLLALDVAVKGYLINERCATSKASGFRWLPAACRLARAYRAGSYSGRQFRCVRPGSSPSECTFNWTRRFARESTGRGRAGSAHTPLLYVEWSPKLVRMYATPSCADSDF